MKRWLISLVPLLILSLGIGLALAQEEEAYPTVEPAYSPEEVAPIVEPVVPVSAGPTNTVQNIEIEDLSEKVRIIITTTQPAEYIIGKIYKPKMFYIDILNSVNDLPRRRFRVRKGPVKRIRSSQHQVLPTEITRIVVDLDKWVKHEVAREGNKLYLEFYKPEVLIAKAPLEEKLPLKKLPLKEKKVPSAEKKAPREEERAPPEEAEKVPLPAERLVSLSFTEAPMSAVLNFLAEMSGYNIVATTEVTKGTITINLKDVPVMTALETILEMQDLWYTRKKNIIRIMTMGEFLSSRAAKSELTRVYRLQYAVATDLAVVLNNILGGAVKKTAPTKISRLESAEAIEKYMAVAGLTFKGKTFVIPDKRTNSLIITTDAPENLIMLENLIKQLDTEVPQVLIEIAIIDVTLTDEDKLGIQWEWNRLYASTAGGDILASPLAGGMEWKPDIVGAYKFFMSNRNIDVLIRAISQRNKLDIISAPRILTLDNEEAVIEVGSEEPLLKSVSYDTDTNQWEYDYTYEKLTTKLTITPQINPDKFVRLKLKQEIRRYKGERIINIGGATGSLPIYDIQNATASMLVKDGHTVIVGGMIKEEITEFKQRIPVLGSIPLLGFFFRTKIMKTERKELIMFATPHVITTPGEAREVTEREKALLTIPPKKVAPVIAKPRIIQDLEIFRDRRRTRKKPREKTVKVTKRKIEIPELEEAEILE